MIRFFLLLLLSACINTDYMVVGGGSGETIIETVYEEVEVPVYIYEEVPTDPGKIWIDSFTQPMSVDGVDILWVIDT